MPEWLYEAGPNGLLIFLLLTMTLGGSAAFATGQAIAATWRPLWQVPVYALLLALAVRFLHFALFEEPLLAPSNLLIDYFVLLSAAGLGHRLARAGAMTRQYDWLYEIGPRLGWRRRGDGENPMRSRDSG